MATPATIPLVAPSTTAVTPASQLTIDAQSPAVLAMGKDWPLIEALLGGTRAMRGKTQLVLPMQPRESPFDYSYRSGTATLYPALSRTSKVMCGKPFAKQLTLGQDTPEPIKEVAENIDAQGRNAHRFFYDIFEEALDYGIAGVLVDTPVLVAAGEGQAPPTLADVRAQGVRPYFTFIRHGDVLGWKTTKAAGVTKLSQLRLRETIEADDGPYGTTQKEAVRLLTPGAWEIHARDSMGNYAIQDSGLTGLDEITYVPFYGRRLDFMIGESPLVDLAYLNVKHYQVQSDQDDSTRFARKRLLVFIGVEAKDMTDAEASSSVALRFSNEQTKVEVVQGSAESVTVGREELAALEEQMVRTGAELLVMMPGGQRTATQDNNEAEGNKSELQRMVETFEDGIDQCLQFAALYLGLEEGGHASLFKDFGAANLSDASADLVLKLQSAGLITKVTAIKEQQRRGLLSADLDPEVELEAVEAEGPPPGQDGLDEFGNPLPPPMLLPGLPGQIPQGLPNGG